MPFTESGIEVYSWSSLANYLSCHRKFKWRYEDLLTPEGHANNLEFGTLMHKVLETWYTTYDYDKTVAALLAEASGMHLAETMDEEPIYSVERARKIFDEYLKAHEEDDKEIVPEKLGDHSGLEIPFLVEVDELDPPFLYAGTMDGLVRRSGVLYGLEHKTASRVDKAYLNSFRPNHQITGYCWGLSNYLTEPVNNFLVNIIHLLKTETRFIRLNVTRTPYEIEGFKEQLIEIVRDIRSTRERGAWYQNTVACSMYGGCAYRELCTSNPQHLKNFIASAYREEFPRDLDFVRKMEKENTR